MFGSTQNPKCRDLPKFKFSGGGGCSVVVKIQSAKICLNFNAGGCSIVVKTQSAKICLNFHFLLGGVGGSVLYQIPE